MRKSISIVILFYLSASIKVEASYYKTYFPKLIEKSSVIIFGEIVEVNDESFLVRCLEKIKGTNLNDTIRIKKFRNWTCAARYDEYNVTQKAIFFLIFNADNKLQSIGAANEGELIVKSDTCYVEDEQKSFKSKKIDFISEHLMFIPIPKNEVIEGVKIYLRYSKEIEEQLKTESRGEVLYKYDKISKLPNNVFLTIVIYQKQKEYSLIKNGN